MRVGGKPKERDQVEKARRIEKEEDDIKNDF